MNRDANIPLVQDIMQDFASLTGLQPENAHPQRYLWTDAFAVCNYLELYRRTNEKSYLDLALRLVDQVHHTLGRHREDDERRGWISGPSEQDGEGHPTRGGLRIGKKLNERKPEEPADERLEWDQDGQYFHYLTKWMHALSRVSQATGDPRYLGWAMELAKAAHGRFTYMPPGGGRKRMYWKMSIDLSYPLVTSMGGHDPLDGFVTYSELQAAARIFKDSSLPDLTKEIAEMAGICRGTARSLATDDPLGIGGLLSDASRIALMMMQGGFEYGGLLQTVVGSAQIGMEAFLASGSLQYPAEYRLPFREFGISVGLSAVDELARWVKERPEIFSRESYLQRRVEALVGYLPIRETIEGFWMDEKNKEAGTWVEHREINMVMLGTSLAPGEFLRI